MKKKAKGEKRPSKDTKFYGRIIIKKCEYHRERNKNISEEQKYKLVEYRRSYYITHNE